LYIENTHVTYVSACVNFRAVCRCRTICSSGISLYEDRLTLSLTAAFTTVVLFFHQSIQWNLQASLYSQYV